MKHETSNKPTDQLSHGERRKKRKVGEEGRGNKGKKGRKERGGEVKAIEGGERI